jgi:uncharacterized repeat protein (TIGR01451 family)
VIFADSLLGAGLAVVKSGSGQLSLEGPLNTVTSMTASAGTLRLSGGGSGFSLFATAGVPVTLAAGSDLLTLLETLGGLSATFNQPVITLNSNSTWTLNGQQYLTLDNLSLSNSTIVGQSELRSLGGTLVVHPAAGSSTLSTLLHLESNTAMRVADGEVTKDLVISSTISGNANLSFIGAGRVVITSTNTHSGLTIITNGTLQLGDSGLGGSFGTGAVSNDSDIVLNRDDAFQLDNVISGRGTLTQVGTNTVELIGANTYQGDTVVSSGRVFVSGSLLATGEVFVAGGGTLGGSGAVGYVIATNRGIITAGGTNGIGVLTATGLSMGSDATSTTRVNAVVGNATGRVTVTALNGLSVTGRVPLYITGNSVVPGVYDLIQYAGVIGGDGFGAFVTGSLPAGVAFASIEDSGSAIRLNVSSTGFPVWVGGVLGNWDLAGGLEWKLVNTLTPMAYLDGAQARFDDTATDFSVNVPAQVSPQDVLVTNSTTYIFSGVGGIHGSASLVKDGPGRVIFAVSNAYAGTTEIRQGVFQVGNGGTAGSLGFGAVTNDALMVYNLAGSHTTSNAISGTGALHVAGSGAIIVTRPMTYQGVTELSNGVLQVTGAGTLPGQPVHLQSRLAFHLSGAQTFTNQVTGTGTLELAATATRSVEIEGDMHGFAGHVYLSNGVRLAHAGFAPGLTGSHVSVLSGAQLWLGTGANFRARSLTIAGTGWGGDGVNGVMGALRIDEATYSGNITLANSSAISPAYGTGVLSGNISGPFQVQYLSASLSPLGTIILLGTNTHESTTLTESFSGNLLVIASNAQALSTGAMTINGGTLRLSGYSFSFDSLSGTRGTIENRSATSPSVVSIGAGQLVAQVNTYSGILTDGAAASLSLVKDGVGTEVLTGTNTYSGPTWVSNGVLLINGQLTGTGVVYVVTNGTLGGYGSVSNVTLVGGKVSPGPAKTNFLIRGSAVVNTGSSYKWEITNAVGIAGTHWDLLTVSNALDFTAAAAGSLTIDVTCASATLAGFDDNLEQSWKIASAGSIVGFATNKFDFNSSNFQPGLSGATLDVVLDGTDIYLKFIPATATDLTVTMTDNPDPVGLGSNIIYSILVSNKGPDIAAIVYVTNYLPANGVYVSSSGGGVHSSGIVRWQLNSGLGVFAKTTLTVTVQAQIDGVVTSVVTVLPSGGDLVMADNIATALTAVTCATNAGPQITASDKTGTEGVLLSFTVSAVDPGCGAPTSLVATGLPSGVSFSTAVTGLTRVGTFTWTPTAAQVGTHLVRFLATDAENKTTSRQIRVYVRMTGEGTNSAGVPASQLNWSPITNIDFATSGNATLIWNSAAGLVYDVYRSDNSVGSGQPWSWTMLVNGTNTVATQSMLMVGASVTQRFFQVVPAGEAPASNGLWGVIRPTIPAGYGLFGPPVMSDRSFVGEFGSNLAARLTSGDTTPDNGNGDEVFVRQADGTYQQILLSTASGWIVATNGLSANVTLQPGQGVYVLRNGSTVTGEFAGAVGNLAQLGTPQSTNTIYEGYNIVSMSQGRLVNIQNAFSDTIAGDPYGSNDDQQADQIIIQVPNGSGIWHRYFYGADNQWHDVQQIGFPAANIDLRPGQAYFYLRHAGSGNMTTRY